MIFDPAIWLFWALLALLSVLAVALARTRALIAAAFILSAYLGVSAVALLALAAPDAALAQAALGVGVLTPLALAAIALTGRSAQPAPPRWAPLAAAAALGAALAAAAVDLAPFGAESLAAGRAAGTIYVNRALRESGMGDAVAAIAVNYRVIDAVVAGGTVFLAALGAYAVLGFGERAGPKQGGRA